MNWQASRTQQYLRPQKLSVRRARHRLAEVLPSLHHQSLEE